MLNYIKCCYTCCCLSGLCLKGAAPTQSIKRLTEHGSRRYRFSIQPERHLGENDCHDAREVRLDDKVANLPLQVEMSCHHCVFTCGDEKPLLPTCVRGCWSSSNHLFLLMNTIIDTVISARFMSDGFNLFFWHACNWNLCLKVMDVLLSKTD